MSTTNPVQTQYPPCVLQFARAVAHAEGFGVPDAIPTKANNPGDLTFGFGYPLNGTMGRDQICVFQSLDDGWQALWHEVGLAFAGRSHIYKTTDTIEEFGMKYSNDPNWGVNVAAYLGVAKETTLAQLREGVGVK